MLSGTVDGVSPDETVVVATLARIREFCLAASDRTCRRTIRTRRKGFAKAAPSARGVRTRACKRGKLKRAL
jgi:hypothetical protein